MIMFTYSTSRYKEFPAGMFIQIENIDEVFARTIKTGAVSLREIDNREYRVRLQWGVKNRVVTNGGLQNLRTNK